MNHRIFERKLRSLDIQGACLSERRLTIYTHFVWEDRSCISCVSFYGLEPCSTPLVYCLEGSTCFCPSLVVSHCVYDVFYFDLVESFYFWPQIRQDYPLNLSILISGGKETNKDSLSNGEWSGTSSNLKSLLLATANCSLEKRFQGECAVLKLLGTAHRRGWQSRTRHCASLTMRFLWVGLLGNAAQNWR